MPGRRKTTACAPSPVDFNCVHKHKTTHYHHNTNILFQLVAVAVAVAVVSAVVSSLSLLSSLLMVEVQNIELSNNSNSNHVISTKRGGSSSSSSSSSSSHFSSFPRHFIFCMADAAPIHAEHRTEAAGAASRGGDISSRSRSRRKSAAASAANKITEGEVKKGDVNEHENVDSKFSNSKFNSGNTKTLDTRTNNNIAILALPTGVLFATQFYFYNNDDNVSSTTTTSSSDNTTTTTNNNSTTGNTTSSSSNSSIPIYVGSDGGFFYGAHGKLAFPTTIVRIAGAGGGTTTSNCNNNNRSSSSSSSSTPPPPTMPALLSCGAISTLRYYTPNTAFLFPVPPVWQPTNTSSPSADRGGPTSVINGTCSYGSGNSDDNVKNRPQQRQKRQRKNKKEEEEDTMAVEEEERNIFDDTDNSGNIYTIPTQPAVITISLDTPPGPLPTTSSAASSSLSSTEHGKGESTGRHHDNDIISASESSTTRSGGLARKVAVALQLLEARYPYSDGVPFTTCALLSAKRWWPVTDPDTLHALQAAIPKPPPPPPSSISPLLTTASVAGAPFTNLTLVAVYAQATADGDASDVNDTFPVAMLGTTRLLFTGTSSSASSSASSSVDDAPPSSVPVPVYRLTGLVLVYEPSPQTQQQESQQLQAQEQENDELQAQGEQRESTNDCTMPIPFASDKTETRAGAVRHLTTKKAQPTPQVITIFTGAAFMAEGGAGAGAGAGVRSSFADDSLAAVPSAPAPVAPFINFKGNSAANSDLNNMLSMGFASRVQITMPNTAYGPDAYLERLSFISNAAGEGRSQAGTTSGGVCPLLMNATSDYRWTTLLELEDTLASFSCAGEVTAGGVTALFSTDRGAIATTTSDYPILRIQGVTPPSSSSFSARSSSGSSSSSSVSAFTTSSPSWLFPADAILSDLYESLGGDSFFNLDPPNPPPPPPPPPPAPPAPSPPPENNITTANTTTTTGASISSSPPHTPTPLPNIINNTSSTKSQNSQSRQQQSRLSGDGPLRVRTMLSSIPGAHSGVYGFGLYYAIDPPTDVDFTGTVTLVAYGQDLTQPPTAAAMSSIGQQWTETSSASPPPPTPAVCPWLWEEPDYNRDGRLCVGDAPTDNPYSGGTGGTEGSDNTFLKRYYCSSSGRLRTIAVGLATPLLVTSSSSSSSSSSTASSSSTSSNSVSRTPLVTTLPVGECVLLGGLLSAIGPILFGFGSTGCKAIVQPPIPRDALGYASSYMLRSSMPYLSSSVQDPATCVLPSSLYPSSSTPSSTSSKSTGSTPLFSDAVDASTTTATATASSLSSSSAASSSSSSACPRWPSSFPIMGPTLPYDATVADLLGSTSFPRQTAFLTNEEALCAFNQYLVAAPSLPMMGVTFLCSADRQTIFVMSCGGETFPASDPTTSTSNRERRSNTKFNSNDYFPTAAQPPFLGANWSEAWAMWALYNPVTTSSGLPPYYAALGGVPLLALNATGDPSGLVFSCSACRPIIGAAGAGGDGVSPLPYGIIAISALKDAFLVAVAVWLMSFQRLRKAAMGAVARLSAMIVPLRDPVLSRRLGRTIRGALTPQPTTAAELAVSYSAFIDMMSGDGVDSLDKKKNSAADAAVDVDRLLVERSFLAFLAYYVFRGCQQRVDIEQLRRLLQHRLSNSSRDAEKVDSGNLTEIKEKGYRKRRRERDDDDIDDDEEEEHDDDDDEREMRRVLISNDASPSIAAAAATTTAHRHGVLEVLHHFLALKTLWRDVVRLSLEEAKMGKEEEEEKKMAEEDDTHSHLQCKSDERGKVRENEEENEEKVEEEEDPRLKGNNKIKLASASDGKSQEASTNASSSLLLLRPSINRRGPIISSASSLYESLNTYNDDAGVTRTASDAAIDAAVVVVCNGRKINRQQGINRDVRSTKEDIQKEIKEEKSAGNGSRLATESSFISHLKINLNSESTFLDTNRLTSQKKKDFGENIREKDGGGCGDELGPREKTTTTITTKRKLSKKRSEETTRTETTTGRRRRTRAASLQAAAKALWASLEDHHLLIPVVFTTTTVDRHVTPPVWLLQMHLLYCMVFMIVILVEAITVHRLPCAPLLSADPSGGYVAPYPVQAPTCVFSSPWIVYQSIYFRYVNSTTAMSLIVNAVLRVLYLPPPPPPLDDEAPDTSDEAPPPLHLPDDDAIETPEDDDDDDVLDCDGQTSSTSISSLFLKPSDISLIFQSSRASANKNKYSGGGGRRQDGNDGANMRITCLEENSKEEEEEEEEDCKGEEQQQQHLVNVSIIEALQYGTLARDGLSVVRRAATDPYVLCGLLLPLPVLLTHALVGVVLYAWIILPVVGLLGTVTVVVERWNRSFKTNTTAAAAAAIAPTTDTQRHQQHVECSLSNEKQHQQQQHEEEEEERSPDTAATPPATRIRIPPILLIEDLKDVNEKEKEEGNKEEREETMSGVTMSGPLLDSRESTTTTPLDSDHRDHHRHPTTSSSSASSSLSSYSSLSPPSTLRLLAVRLFVRVLLTIACTLLLQSTVNWMVLAYTGGTGNQRLTYEYPSEDSDATATVPAVAVPNTFLFRHRFPPPADPQIAFPFDGVPMPTAVTSAAVERLQDTQYLSYIGVLVFEFNARSMACTLELLYASLTAAFQTASVLF